MVLIKDKSHKTKVNFLNTCFRLPCLLNEKLSFKFRTTYQWPQANDCMYK